MNTQGPEEITREWLQEWMGDRFPAVVLHQKGREIGYYDRDEGVESFRSFRYSWRALYNYLKDNDIP